jgi:hypothetical protein
MHTNSLIFWALLIDCRRPPRVYHSLEMVNRIVCGRSGIIRQVPALANSALVLSSTFYCGLRLRALPWLGFERV